ncbi:class I SAM-dependent methyltransferase [Pseudomonas sp. 91RF]|jgi:SAM-dependent methyltransferase|uniref:class I SAM-dependent methyltransferase n=1 Tax=Pseudomonas sp. 91RF TaxID=2292261 RepID=UPI000E663FF4|nr:class I SAM-dependent methyltransferase [Pseudomonas sp. 91RF]RIJ12853.1 class I SAM-dependent methyltransferase [Pseudomonas sp. 91RF]
MKSQFDELPRLYEEMADWPFRSCMEIPNVLALLGNVTHRDVLDFGCGNGMYSRWLREAGASRVVGYDVSDGMLHYAKRREEKDKLGIEYTSRLDASHEAKFDKVLAVYVIPYADTRQALLEMCEAMARVLRPGGQLVALPIHPEYHRNPAYYEPYGLRMTPEGPDIDGGKIRLDLILPPYDASVRAFYWGKDTLERAMLGAGFKLVQWVQPGLPNEPEDDESNRFMRDYWLKPHAAIMNCQR